MIYIIENDTLKVKISSMGAELQSIRRPDDNTEYLWQGDANYWAGRALNLFPICGRLFEGKYIYRGRIFEMMLHGFAKLHEWTVLRQDTAAITLQLKDNADTLAVYPFHFSLEISYVLSGKNLTVTGILHNCDDRPLYFSAGSYVGFRVPLNNNEEFSDYFLQFNTPTAPQQLCINRAGLYTEKTKPFPLEDEHILRLQHTLFDNNALYLQNTGGHVTLGCEKNSHSIHIEYSSIPYLVLSQKAKTTAPYICIGLTTGCPAADGKIANIETLPTLHSLEPEGVERYTYTLTFR